MPLIHNHHHLALQDVGDKMVVMQDGGDLVTILPCSQISLKNGMLPISTKQKLISCATYQKHIIYGNSIVMISFITKKKTNGPPKLQNLSNLKNILFCLVSNPSCQRNPESISAYWATSPFTFVRLNIFILYFFAHWAAISEGMSDSGFS